MKRIQFPTNKLYLLFLVSFCTISCNNDSDLLTDYVISRDENGQFGMLVVNDYFETNSKNSIILDVLSNDRFSENEEVKIIEISNPKLGAVKVNENNTITYTPPTEILEEEGFTETPTNESPAEPTPEEETPSSEETPSDQNPPVEAPPATSSSSEEEPGSNENVTDTFTYTTEVVNEDETVSTEVGTVEVVIITTDNSTSEPTIPDPVTPNPVTTNATLLFSSGFEGVNLSPRNGDYQYITGTDRETGFSWPPNVWGSADSGIHRIQDGGGGGIDNYLENTIGHSGVNTTTLFTRVNYSSGGATQSPYQINRISKDPNEIYIKYWMKIDATSLSTNGSWRAIWEYKSDEWFDNGGGDGFRGIAFIGRNGSGELYWRIQGDDSPSTPIWGIEKTNSQVPVPREEWFKVEYYVKLSNSTDGRIWMKVNDELIGDQSGATLGPTDDSMSFMILTQVYGNTLPMHQFVDDLEIWDGVPY